MGVGALPARRQVVFRGAEYKSFGEQHGRIRAKMSDRAPHLPPHLEGQSSSWLSKATSASILGHPLVWTGMTAVFILIGYLWLQYYARPLSDRLGVEHLDSELIGGDSDGAWNPDIYRSVETQEEMNITRQADDLRADNYREIIDRATRIQPLLDKAVVQG